MIENKRGIFMVKGAKVGIVCCSNGQLKEYQESVEMLEKVLLDMGLISVFSDYIYARDSIYSGTAAERAEALMNFYKDEEIRAIFDISGGDIANEILPYLDFEVIARTDKQFWGYSDLTTIINAIYAKTGKASVLYQVKNLIWDESGMQLENYASSVLENEKRLFSPTFIFAQKKKMQGVVVGGNIRCLLKLAGTPYWPDMNNKILLLESLGGEVPQMVTYLNQLKQMGVFEKINGILLGTFTTMEKNHCVPDIVTLVKKYVGEDLPIAVTGEIGHGTDSKAVIIGGHINYGNITIVH